MVIQRSGLYIEAQSKAIKPTIVVSQHLYKYHYN